LLPTVLVFLVAFVAALELPLRYRASALVQAEWEKTAEEALRRIGLDVSNRGLLVVRERVLSRLAIERVLQEVSPGRGRADGTRPVSAQIQAIRAAVSVKALGTNVFRIEYVSGDAGSAALVPNRLARLLIEATESDRVKRAQTDPATLEVRLAEARKSMDAALAALRRRGAAPGDSAVESGSAPAERARLEAERRTVSVALSAAEARAGRLRQAIEGQVARPAAEGGGTAELARLRAERDELRKRYTEAHPDIVALTVRIRRLEAQVEPSTTLPPASPTAEALAAELAQVEAEIKTLRRRRDELAAAIANLVSRGRASPGARPPSAPERDLEVLTRDFEQAQAAYLALRDEQLAAETEWRLAPGAPPRFQILQQAQVPERPYFPNRLLFALTGLALGLALGLSAALVAERRDPSVKGPEDLRDLLPEPLLAEIPLVRLPRASRRARTASRSSGSQRDPREYPEGRRGRR
jgi:succinoglycan biosynthesis transport protein ExoP